MSEKEVKGKSSVMKKDGPGYDVRVRKGDSSRSRDLFEQERKGYGDSLGRDVFNDNDINYNFGEIEVVLDEGGKGRGKGRGNKKSEGSYKLK